MVMPRKNTSRKVATAKAAKKTPAPQKIKGFTQVVVAARSDWPGQPCRACQCVVQTGEELMVVKHYRYSGYGRSTMGGVVYHRHCVEQWLVEHPAKSAATKPARLVKAEEIEAEFNALREALTETYAVLLAEPDPEQPESAQPKATRKTAAKKAAPVRKRAAKRAP